MKKGHTSLLLTISLAVNIILGAFTAYTCFFEAPPSAVTDMKEAGIYGPDSIEIIEGDATIATAGVTLQNTIVKGNLMLAEAIGDGSVDLVNVTVEGTALVQGGGEESIVLENTLIKHLHICKKEGKIKIALKGNTLIEKVTLEGEVALDAAAITGEGGIKELLVKEGAEAEFNGLFPLINIEGSDVKASLLAGKIDKLVTAKGSSKCLLSLAQDTEIGLLETGEALDLTGEGLVKEILINSPGLTRLTGTINLIKTGGKGIFLEIDKGTTDTLVVESSDGTVMIHLLENAIIKFMELNSAAGVTGKGLIESVLINAPGTVIEQSPGKVELAKDMTAEIAGKVVQEEVEVKPEPKPEQPATPAVTLSSLKNMVLAVGKTGTRDLTLSPKDAKISVKSSNSSVAAVTLSGKSITVTAGNTAGTATITVTATKSGYTSKSRKFTVTVNAIKSVIVKEGLTPGNKLVIVQLYYADPASYTVTVGGHPLTYSSGNKVFQGEVPENDANGTVRVTR